MSQLIWFAAAQNAASDQDLHCLHTESSFKHLKVIETPNNP